MKLSLKTQLLIVGLCAILFLASFGLPSNLGISLLCLVSCLMPAFVMPAILYSRDETRAFFVGCALAGFPHFVANTIMVVTAYIMLMSDSYIEFDDLFLEFENAEFMVKSMHGLCYGFALLGGFLALVSYRIFKEQKKTELPAQQAPSKTEEVLFDDLED